MLICLLVLCCCSSLSCPYSDQFIPWSITLLYKTLSMDLTTCIHLSLLELQNNCSHSRSTESESVLQRFPLTCEMHLGSYMIQLNIQQQKFKICKNDN